MSFLSEKEKKSFFKLLETEVATGLIKKHHGTCIKMQADLNEGPLLLVSSCSTFPDQGSVIQGSMVVAEQCFGNDTIDVDVSKLKSNQGVMFMVCNDMNEEYFIPRGELRNPPAQVSAYVVQDKAILELIFNKTEFTSYKFDAKSSMEANKDFRHLELRKAVGAPVIIHEVYGRPKRSQVVGVLEVTSDGMPYPVLFSDNFNNLDTQTTRTPSQESCEQIAEHELLRDESSGVNLSGSDKTDSGVPIKASARTMVTGISQQTAMSSIPTFDSQSQCIKSTTLADANIHQLIQKLKTRLDPEKPFGNDYRALADEFGYKNYEIEFLSSRVSPTEELLRQVGSYTTLEQLKNKLSSMDNRHDLVQDMELYFVQKGCNCEDCGSLR